MVIRFDGNDGKKGIISRNLEKLDNTVAPKKPETINVTAKPDNRFKEEFGDELLTAQTYYPNVSFGATKKPDEEQIEELVAFQQSFRASEVSRADRKEAAEAVSDPLTKAYMYGSLTSEIDTKARPDLAGTKPTLEGLADFMNLYESFV